MNISSTDVFALAERRLAWVGQRQSLLAQNIANANTPGYVAKDVKPFSEFLARRMAHQEDSDPSQVTSAGSSAASSISGRSLDGNTVVLDDQLEKVAETDTAHQLAANLYKKYVSLFKTAIGRN